MAVATPSVARTFDCGYGIGADDLWYVQCEDFDADDHPALQTTAPRILRIPLWSSAPYPDSDPVLLIRAVLCGGRGSACEVRFHDRPDGMPGVNIAPTDTSGAKNVACERCAR